MLGIARRKVVRSGASAVGRQIQRNTVPSARPFGSYGYATARNEVYTFLETTLNTFSLLPQIITLLGEARKRSVLLGILLELFWLLMLYLNAVLNLAFALSLLCFVIMHATLLWSNTTTIEVYEKKMDKKERAPRWKYDLGWKTNIEQVFGTKKGLWFFPVFAKDDLENVPSLQGTNFPVREDSES